MRLALGNVESVVPGRNRKRSQTETYVGSSGNSSLSPTPEVKPKACPISCVATESKSILLESIPSVGSKSNVKFELNATDGGSPHAPEGSPSGFATGFISPTARNVALVARTYEVEPISVGTVLIGKELYKVPSL